ncbi:hypothetical protein LOTGIDRAFT_169717 [Lottia gigantea]|uniref:Fucolectin tachylectin-4 pentraxin-1 domain-containing protein n=1 Tax=Lottia gigantea TaxID=225164 RepID=V3ZQC4_LOTGI|nr:hypothetical protein LOTGIDRAFT_169717 [Lottia gigantea]ESO83081.1 hypothetical protein LOTGIDRAFT_169717 [Lottia gigantea]
MTVIYVVVILVCIGVVGCSGFNDPCTIQPTWWGQDAATENGIKDATANITCTNGSVWWNYPRGRLRLNFDNSIPGREFRVCLSGNMMGSFRSIMDISGAHNRNMNAEPGRLIVISLSRNSFFRDQTVDKPRFDACILFLFRSAALLQFPVQESYNNVRIAYDVTVHDY